jgi:transposase
MPKDANGHGRDPKLTDEIATKIVQAVRTGTSLEGAASYAGVPRQTFFDWLRRGRQPRAYKPYRDLALAIDEALGVFEANANALIAKAAHEQWPAAAWQLERKFPDKYGRRTRIDGSVQVQAIVASPEWIGLRDRVLAALQPYPEALEAVLQAVGAADRDAEIEGEILELTA